MKLEFDEKAWQALLKKSLKAKSAPEPDPFDPITQVVFSFLHWRATQTEAEDALGRIMSVMVDINELRVSNEVQIVELVGTDYPFAQERVARMIEVLNELFVREHAVSMKSIEASAKKDQRHYLDTLPGMVPFVAARVMLLTFGGHAFPVDDRTVSLLAKGSVVHESASPGEMESILLRQVKAADTLAAYLAIQGASDRQQKWPTDVVTAHAPAVASVAADEALKLAVSNHSQESKAAAKTTKKTKKKSSKQASA
ncbi:MAG: hypothetical protein RIG82_11475 [Phycisphaeraceae bacterium]